MRETPVHELTPAQRRAEIVQILTMAVRRWDQQRGRAIIEEGLQSSGAEAPTKKSGLTGLDVSP